MKKKIYLMGLIGLLLLTGCSKGYKEGTYTGTAIDTYGGEKYRYCYYNNRFSR